MAPRKQKNVLVEHRALELDALTFAPTIDARSAEMVHTRGHSVPIYEVLLQEGKNYDDQHEARRRSLKDKELEGCTFKPRLVAKKKNYRDMYSTLMAKTNLVTTVELDAVGTATAVDERQAPLPKEVSNPGNAMMEQMIGHLSNGIHSPLSNSAGTGGAGLFFEDHYSQSEPGPQSQEGAMTELS